MKQTTTLSNEPGAVQKLFILSMIAPGSNRIRTPLGFDDPFRGLEPK